jgi:hypothetical protein
MVLDDCLLRPYQVTEKAVFNPLNPPILGDFLFWGNTPRPSAGRVLHLFFGNLLLKHQQTF